MQTCSCILFCFGLILHNRQPSAGENLSVVMHVDQTACTQTSIEVCQVVADLVFLLYLFAKYYFLFKCWHSLICWYLNPVNDFSYVVYFQHIINVKYSAASRSH